MTDCAIEWIAGHSDWSPAQKRRAVQSLQIYRKREWRQTGRLARLGLPESFVRGTRRLRSSLLD